MDSGSLVELSIATETFAAADRRRNRFASEGSDEKGELASREGTRTPLGIVPVESKPPFLVSKFP